MLGRRAASLALASALAAGVASGCTAGGVSARTAAIVGGAPETGHAGVYLLYRRDGVACTSTLIADRVVLTARHCVMDAGDVTVAPEQIRLYAGNTSSTFFAEHAVSRVEILPGSSAALRDGTASDLALLVLTVPAAEPPYPLARDVAPEALVGLEATAVGFGDTEDGSDGNKVSTTMAVASYDAIDGLYWVAPTLCDGDSGGPLLGPDGRVHGVASFTLPLAGQPPTCGADEGAYNEIARHLPWIDSVLASVGSCAPRSEVCNGADDDCNGAVDEGCSPLGTSCATSDTCVGGLCADTASGRICTAACDLHTTLGCAAGSHCESSGCEGYCVPGAPGASAIGAGCATDAECASGHCADGGDGRLRCLAFCRLDARDCLAREVCSPLAGSCGGCVDAASVSGPRGLGEPCASASECRSSLCASNGECASPCGAGGTCGEGELCRDGACIADRRQPAGAPCLDDHDCLDGACTGEIERYCTRTCSAVLTCPPGMGCDFDSLSCVPERALDGAPCDAADDCISRLCGTVGGTSAPSCLRACDRDTQCSAGYECSRSGDRGVCVRPASGGCSAGRGVRHRTSVSWFLAALGAAAACRRRKRA
jgi:V8-like Glu-specific endopeptidase